MIKRLLRRILRMRILIDTGKVTLVFDLKSWLVGAAFNDWMGTVDFGPLELMLLYCKENYENST